MESRIKEKIQLLIDGLERANARLKEAYELPEEPRINKDGTIQRFEFTFELAWKLMQAVVIDQGFECRSPKNCIRLAAQINLIDKPGKWFKYLEARNLSTHIYKEILADSIYEQAKGFADDVEKLLTASKQIDSL